MWILGLDNVVYFSNFRRIREKSKKVVMFKISRHKNLHYVFRKFEIQRGTYIHCTFTEPM